MTAKKYFPQGFPLLKRYYDDWDGVNYIPWDVICKCESQAIINHSQNLYKLASRGGLSPMEAMAVLLKKRLNQFGDLNPQQCIDIIEGCIEVSSR